MWDMQTTTTQKASKEYHCEASDWVVNALDNEVEFSVEEMAIIEKAKSENFKILKGTEYTKTTGKWDGDFATFRARIDLDKLCLERELYPE